MTHPAQQKEQQDKSAQIKAKKLEEKRAKEEKEYRAHIEKQLGDANYTEVDDRKYSFVFNGNTLVFRLPSLLEKTKIKSILSQIAYSPDGMFSATKEIAGSGDLDLICNTKLLTHMSILCDEVPKGIDVESLNDSDQFNLGYLILISEREFIDRKKKVSTGDQ